MPFSGSAVAERLECLRKVHLRDFFAKKFLPVFRWNSTFASSWTPQVRPSYQKPFWWISTNFSANFTKFLQFFANQNGIEYGECIRFMNRPMIQQNSISSRNFFYNTQEFLCLDLSGEKFTQKKRIDSLHWMPYEAHNYETVYGENSSLKRRSSDLAKLLGIAKSARI